MKTKIIFLFLLVILAAGCGKKKSEGYSIGVDGSWYPLELSGKENNVLVFSIELLKEIGKREKLPLSITEINWDSLLWGLREDRYNAVLSSMQPYNFYEKLYSFSDLYLMTGPVLVTRKESEMATLSDMKGKEIAIVRGSSAALFLQRYPGIIIRPYTTIPDALTDLEAMVIDGAAIEILMAQSYVSDLFQEELKIASGPLTDQGLRMVTLKKMDPKLIKSFDKGLKAMAKDGSYDKLMMKWGLSPGSPQEAAALEAAIHTFLQHHS
ncbi:MAG: ABC transporter arginine-binding protein 1 [Chlamydiae bacterium]|nr:ABC transporter arginine-binding protein 1 [Chlamydiota bacterium]